MAKAAAKKTAAKTKTKTPAPKPVKAAAAKTAKATKALPPKKPVAKTPAVKAPVVKKPAVTKAAAAVRAPVVSKDELRAQVEKLNGTITTLRSKNREAVKALKAAETRIAALEHEISQIEVKPVAEKPVAPRKPRAVKAKPAPVEVGEEVVELPEPQDDAGDELGGKIIAGAD